MSDLFTQQSTTPELFKTGEDIAEELKSQTVEPNTATDFPSNLLVFDKKCGLQLQPVDPYSASYRLPPTYGERFGWCTENHGHCGTVDVHQDWLSL